MATYTIGSLVRVSTLPNHFRDASGAPCDPTTVTLLIRSPDKVETSYPYGSSAVVRDGYGAYHFDVGPLTQAGAWSYRWVGTGAVIAAAEGRFDVRKSAFTNP